MKRCSHHPSYKGDTLSATCLTCHEIRREYLREHREDDTSIPIAAVIQSIFPSYTPQPEPTDLGITFEPPSAPEPSGFEPGGADFGGGGGGADW